MKSILALALLLVSSLALAEDHFKATGIRVIDGDTLAVEHLEIGFGVSLDAVKVRLRGIDAWEITGAEKEKGLRAKEAMKEISSSGVVYLVPARGSPSRDNFGRLLAWMYVLVPNEKPIRADIWMLERNHGEKR